MVVQLNKTIEKLQNKSKGIDLQQYLFKVTASGNCWRFSGDNPLGNMIQRGCKIHYSINKKVRAWNKPRSTMTCYPIDTDGNIIKAGYLATTGGAQQKKLKEGEFSETAKTFLIALGIRAGVILAIVLVSFIKKLKSNKGRNLM